MLCVNKVQRKVVRTVCAYEDDLKREELERLEEAILDALHRDLGARSAVYLVADPARYRRYCQNRAREAAFIRLSDLDVIAKTGIAGEIFVCSDALEGLDEDDLEAVLRRICALGKPAIFFIATRPAKRLLSDGNNPRALIQPYEWWRARLEAHFDHVQVMRVPGRQACAFATWRPSEVGLSLLKRHRRVAKWRRSVLRLRRRVMNRINLLDRPPKQAATLLRRVEGKRVAVVGNATSLSEQDYGALIDSHDIVVRFNMMPIVSAQSHGVRTDWLATHRGLSRAFFEARGASTMIWLGDDLKLMPGWTILKAPTFVWLRRRDLSTLSQTLGAPPTAGVALIDLLARSSAAEISLFGFDFMRSGTLSTWRPTAAAEYDFDGEARYVRQLVQEVDRFTVYGAGPDG